jgi:hypothetical protein
LLSKYDRHVAVRRRLERLRAQRVPFVAMIGPYRADVWTDVIHAADR